jgi:hypothetical protein
VLRYKDVCSFLGYEELHFHEVGMIYSTMFSESYSKKGSLMQGTLCFAQPHLKVHRTPSFAQLQEEHAAPLAPLDPPLQLHLLVAAPGCPSDTIDA